MTLWSSSDIAAATGGTAHGHFNVEAVTFDSREVIGGELFVAMKGEETDGHKFVDAAAKRGASGFLVCEAVDAPHVRVHDGLAALEALGRAARERTAATIFGVTGSVGKTSVKEALRFALAEVAPDHTHWSVKSYNNHTGVPLSLSRMPMDARFGIFEMGMNHAGELAALTRLVRPDVALITWVTSAHLEFFEDEAAIADAKGEIFEGLGPDGTAILPFDNPHFERLQAKARAHAGRLISFGGPGADVSLVRAAREEARSTVIADVCGERCGYTVAMPGDHWIQNSLAVMAAAYAAGADLAAAGLGLSQISGMAGRGARHDIPVGDGVGTLIDESYNANSASMAAALALLGAAAPGAGSKRIALLGAMGELGHHSDRLHAELAPHVVAAGADVIILVGREMAPLAEALAGRNVIHVDAAGKALEGVRDHFGPGDILLVKGSNFVGLGAVVAALKDAEN